MTHEPGALGLGPRADHVEKLARDLSAERWGTCKRCGGPCTVAVRRWGPFAQAESRLVRICVDCGRSAGLVDTQPEEDPHGA